MENPFKQPNQTYKISFKTFYKYIEFLEEEFLNLYLDNILSVSLSEEFSSTIEAMPDDIWIFEIYVSSLPNITKFEADIKDFCRENNLSIIENNLNFEEIKEQDWVEHYTQQLKPIQVGKFFITSSIHKNLCPLESTPIIIDSVRAFGTGQHHTTQGCIEALEVLEKLEFNNILDIGTGSGILAIAAKKLWPAAKVSACDIEETAVEIAHINSVINNCEIQVYTNSAAQITSSKDIGIKYDLIVSNILAGPLIMLSQEISELAKSGSYIILAGFLDYQLDNILAHFIAKDFKYEEAFYKDSWVILILKR